MIWNAIPNTDTNNNLKILSTADCQPSRSVLYSLLNVARALYSPIRRR